MCFHSEDIVIECIFIFTILNLSLKGQQSLPILRELQKRHPQSKDHVRSEWTFLMELDVQRMFFALQYTFKNKTGQYKKKKKKIKKGVGSLWQDINLWYITHPVPVHVPLYAQGRC